MARQNYNGKIFIWSDELAHSYKGTSWKEHKYTGTHTSKNGNKIYEYGEGGSTGNADDDYQAAMDATDSAEEELNAAKEAEKEWLANNPKPNASDKVAFAAWNAKYYKVRERVVDAEDRYDAAVDKEREKQKSASTSKKMKTASRSKSRVKDYGLNPNSAKFTSTGDPVAQPEWRDR